MAVYQRETEDEVESEPSHIVRWLVGLLIALLVFAYVWTGLYIGTNWGENGFSGSMGALRLGGAVLAVMTFLVLATLQLVRHSQSLQE